MFASKGQIDVLENAYVFLPLACVSITESGHVLQINRQCTSLLGLNPNLPAYDNWFTIANPINLSFNSNSPSFRDVIQVCRFSSTWTGNIQIAKRIHKDHHSKYKVITIRLLVQKTFYRDESDTPQPFFTCALEECSIASDFQFTVESMPIGFCIWQYIEHESHIHPQFSLAAINSTAERLLGISVPRGSKLDESVDPASNPYVREFFLRILETQETEYRPEFRLGNHEFSLTAFPVANQCVGLILEQCKDPKERLCTLDQSTTPFGLLAKQNDVYVFEYANFGLTALTGCDLVSLLGKELQEFMAPPESRKDAEVEALTAITSNKRGASEIVLISKSDTAHPTLLQYIPMKDSTGRTYRVT